MSITNKKKGKKRDLPVTFLLAGVEGLDKP
jgi:hypothetical protein